jgi:hypothetical protein
MKIKRSKFITVLIKFNYTDCYMRSELLIIKCVHVKENVKMN